MKEKYECPCVEIVNFDVDLNMVSESSNPMPDEGGNSGSTGWLPWV